MTFSFSDMDGWMDGWMPFCDAVHQNETFINKQTFGADFGQ